ncbi:hypothetical protein E4U21_003909 [Claviceps maximensis]|nr:hypothetical protein E4U21_003909 [Claviceps maximensis]
MDQEPDDFLSDTGLPSPSASTTTSSRVTTSLPHPHKQAFRPGSRREQISRAWFEETLLKISRRYVKRFGTTHPSDTVIGFKSMTEVCMELDLVVDILWECGSPSLQIPIFLKIAGDFNQYVPSFAPSPRATLQLLRKLDHCFASLLCGQDIDSKESLPGFENGLREGMTTTDMVRCKSLVEQSRILMIEILSDADWHDEEMEEEEMEKEEMEKEEMEDDDDDDDDDDREADADAKDSTDDTEESAAESSRSDGFSWYEIEERLCMDAARVYENTIIQLGERLGDSLGNENQVDNSTVCAK